MMASAAELLATAKKEREAERVKYDEAMPDIIKQCVARVKRQVKEQMKSDGERFIKVPVPIRNPGTLLCPCRQELNEEETEQHFVIPYTKDGFKVRYEESRCSWADKFLVISWEHLPQ